MSDGSHEVDGQAGVPALAVFDVNETLSDLGGLAARLDAAGGDPAVLPLWFAATLRDGFAITAAGGYAEFSELAVSTLAGLLSHDHRLRDSPDAVAQQVVEAMADLDLHRDVAPGLRLLHRAGVRIVTLSNGASKVADSLLTRAGVRDLVENCLSVADAGRWKPAADAYRFAAVSCGVAATQSVLVAVHPWDIDGALRAGMRAAWISRDGAPYPGFFRAPEVQGESLVKVAALLTGDAGSP